MINMHQALSICIKAKKCISFQILYFMDKLSWYRDGLVRDKINNGGEGWNISKKLL
jgi:hypothetical protein